MIWPNPSESGTVGAKMNVLKSSAFAEQVDVHKIIAMGIDLANNIISVHGQNERDKGVRKKSLKPAAMFGNPPVLHWPQKSAVNGTAVHAIKSAPREARLSDDICRLGRPGIPKLQQVIAQVLAPIFDPSFSASSFGFRTGRNAHQAIRKLQAEVKGGRRIAVDIDLVKFFDTVNHKVLMGLLSRSIGDKCLLVLIGRYLPVCGSASANTTGPGLGVRDLRLPD